LVSITDEGADAVDTVMTRRLAREAALLAGLSKKRRAEIVAALTELRDLVDRQARDQG
jgi:DNA-binding MarR family transcriptional regulator